MIFDRVVSSFFGPWTLLSHNNCCKYYILAILTTLGWLSELEGVRWSLRCAANLERTCWIGSFISCISWTNWSNTSRNASSLTVSSGTETTRLIKTWLLGLIIYFTLFLLHIVFIREPGPDQIKDSFISWPMTTVCNSSSIGQWYSKCIGLDQKVEQKIQFHFWCVLRS